MAARSRTKPSFTGRDAGEGFADTGGGLGKLIEPLGVAGRAQQIGQCLSGTIDDWSQPGDRRLGLGRRLHQGGQRRAAGPAQSLQTVRRLTGRGGNAREPLIVVGDLNVVGQRRRRRASGIGKAGNAGLTVVRRRRDRPHRFCSRAQRGQDIGGLSGTSGQRPKRSRTGIADLGQFVVGYLDPALELIRAPARRWLMPPPAARHQPLSARPA